MVENKDRIYDLQREQKKKACKTRGKRPVYRETSCVLKDTKFGKNSKQKNILIQGINLKNKLVSV